MKNSDRWQPSKFELKNGHLRASRNPLEVGISSRFVVDLVAAYYELHLRDHVKGKLIDLGCGKVPLYDAYKAYITECTCTDWANTKHTNPYVDQTCDLNDPLPFATESFHTVILSDVLEHIAKPDQLWLEMYRILKPGGKVILNVPFLYKLHEVPHDYFRYSKYALQNFATGSGFKIILLQEIGGLPEVITDLVSKLVSSIPIVGKVGAMLIQETNSFLLRTKPGKSLSLKTRDLYPLGYFVVAAK